MKKTFIIIMLSAIFSGLFGASKEGKDNSINANFNLGEFALTMILNSPMGKPFANPPITMDDHINYGKNHLVDLILFSGFISSSLDSFINKNQNKTFDINDLKAHLAKEFDSRLNSNNMWGNLAQDILEDFDIKNNKQLIIVSSFKEGNPYFKQNGNFKSSSIAISQEIDDEDILDYEKMKKFIFSSNKPTFEKISDFQKYEEFISNPMKKSEYQRYLLENSLYNKCIIKKEQINNTDTSSQMYCKNGQTITMVGRNTQARYNGNYGLVIENGKITASSPGITIFDSSTATFLGKTYNIQRTQNQQFLILKR